MVRRNHQGRRPTAQASGRYSHFLRQNVRICGPDILSPSGRNRRSKTYYPSKRQRDRRLYAQILTALGVPQNPRASVVELEQVAIRLMRAMDVQVLLLDEVHNILAGTFPEQRIVLNTLRYISNELQVSLVCFGVNEAREAISGDVQLARRFEEFPLTRWSADDEFEDLVLAIVRNLPLRNPTVLSSRAMRRLLQVTDGITSKVFRLLDQLAIEAIKSGAERVGDDAIDQWQPMKPNERLFA